MRVLRFLLLALLVLAAMAVSAFLGYALYSGDLWGDADDLDPLVVLGAGYLFLGAMVDLALLALLILAVVAVARLFRAGAELFGSHPVARLLSLGLVAMIFPVLVRWLVTQPLRLLLAPLSVIPQRMAEAWSVTSRECARSLTETQEGLGQCVDLLVHGVMTSVSGEVSSFRDALNNVPLHQLLVAMALWAFLGNLISGFLDDEGRAQGLTKALRRVSAARWANLALFVFLGLGGFLSVAAITAIPLLSEDEPLGELRTENLERELEESARLVGFEESHGSLGAKVESMGQALADLSREAESLWTVDPTTDPEAEARSQQQLQDWRSALAKLESSQREVATLLTTTWEDYRDSSAEQLRELVRTTMSQVEVVNLSLTPLREKLKQVAGLRAWAQDRFGWVHEELGRCGLLLDNAGAHLADAEVSLVARAKSDLERGRPPDLRMGESLPSSILQFAVSSCVPTRSVEAAPRSSRSSLGVFRFTRWLVELESLPLALITGLLGFGLLGSAISSFIREMPRRTPGGPLVRDLTGIVVRGLSAAFVVYLGVQGGLAIFSLGGNDPNPHVLLLTCFVAAVFSEDVWQAARRVLRDRLAGPPGADGRRSSDQAKSSAAGDD